jgi:TonB-dependent receptor
MELTAQTVFTFLPAPFNGFGAQVNATFTDAKNVGLFNALNGAELPFPGLSRWSYNLIFFYDRGPINTRVAYNHRDRYLAVVAERSGNPRYQEATGYLDGKFTYRFNPHLSAFVEAQNLTGEREAGNSGDPVRLADFGYSGRRYFAGVQFKY